MAEDIKERLERLEEKYKTMGQDLASYLDGLLYSDFLTYWDYIHLDTLLSLQKPRTALPDEKVFILYHQVTELYFKMILNELEQAAFTDPVNGGIFLKRLQRINRYFDHLTDSFDVMIEGMDQEQFLTFRMALLPASGFQSAQYRLIEIYATDFFMLVDNEKKGGMPANPGIREMYEHLYWKSGATELATGKKTMTLEQFEKKYTKTFIELGEKIQENNLRQKYQKYYKENEVIVAELKKLDQKANVEWPLQHLKSAATYLQKDPEVIKATGGTNWQRYLPPKRQRIIFYPELWSEDERKEWGKKIEKVFGASYA